MQRPYFTLAIKILATAFCSLCFSLSLADTLQGIVISIADGDTITVLDSSNQQHKIRLMGIDAPEKAQAFGNVSKQHLADFVFSKSVSVVWSKRDQYKRIVGKVLLDGQDMNLEQVKAGLAWHYKHYQRSQSDEDSAAYAEAEETARKRLLGLWMDATPVPPWEWRHR